MPELDSHSPSATNPNPLASPYSPWHACGPDFPQYSAAMKRRSHLRLLGATLRLSPERRDIDAAAEQWKHLFGIERNGNVLEFTNAKLTFVAGVEGFAEGLESITIGVKGKDRYNRVLDHIRREGVQEGHPEEGCANMLGIRWYFVLEDDISEEGFRKDMNQSKL